MSDVAISYKSEERAFAYQVADRLRAAGLSVWMDDSAEINEGTAAFGIPPGEQWVDTIVDALTDASVVLVLDSAAWRRSKICRWEHAVADHHGKRIAVLPVGPNSSADADGEPPSATWPVADIDDLIARIGEGADTVRAHTRLLRAAKGRPRQRGFLSFLMSSTEFSDVKTVQKTGSQISGVRLREWMQKYVHDVRRRGARRRWILTSSAVIVIGVLVAASVWAYQNRQSAAQHTQAAQRDAHYEKSLLLADQAVSADSTAEARLLLDQAAAEADTPRLRAARAQVGASAYQRNVAWLPGAEPANPYVGWALSDDARTVVIASRTDVTVFDTQNGQRLHQYPVPPGIRPAMVQIAPDGRIVVATRDQPGVLEIDKNGATKNLTSQPVSQFSVDDRGSLWIVDGQGSVSRDGHDSGLPLHQQPATAVAVDRGAGAVSVLYADGYTERFETRDGHLQSVEYTNLFATPGGAANASSVSSAASNAEDMTSTPPEDLAERNRMFGEYYNNSQMKDLQDAGVGSPYPDQLLRCGPVLLAYHDHTISWQPAPGSPGTAISPKVAFSSTRSMACFGDAGLAQEMAAPAVAVFPPSATGPASLFRKGDASGVTMLASNRSGDHLSVLHPDGRLEVSEVSHLATRVTVAPTTVVCPFGDTVVTVGPNGETLLNGQPAPAERAVNTAVRERNPALAQGRAAVTAEDAAVVIDAGGVVARHTSPGRAVDFVRTAAKGTFVASVANGFFEVDPESPSGEHRAVPVPGLRKDEAITDIDMNNDVVVVATNYGRLLLLKPATGQLVRARDAIQPSSEYSIALSRDGKHVIGLGADGLLTTYDVGSLNSVRSTNVGAAARTLRFSARGDLLVAATIDNRVLLLDPETLETLQVISDSAELSHTFVLDPAETSVFGLTGDGTQMSLQRVPVVRGG